MAKRSEAEIIQSSVDLKMQELTAHILGVTPFVCNAMGPKTLQQLLYPTGRKSTAEKAVSMKHDPMTEYRTSPYRSTKADAVTRIEMVAVSFKHAIESIALDVPGATKTQIQRNLVTPDQRIALYGIPELFMATVKSGDMAKTPDVRTRAIIPRWACTLRLRFPFPLFKEKIVQEYLALAGLLRGVGDFRPERGSGSYGQFEIVSGGDPRWHDVVATGGRKAQDEALESPEPFDDQTQLLLEWFEGEKARRGQVTARNGKSAEEVRA